MTYGKRVIAEAGVLAVLILVMGHDATLYRTDELSNGTSLSDPGGKQAHRQPLTYTNTEI